MEIPKYFYFRVRGINKGTSVEVEDASDVDVVEVVRCKDCRYYEPENHNCVDEMGYARIWEENEFCSFGERREDEID